jgi:hypothetical protein
MAASHQLPCVPVAGHARTNCGCDPHLVLFHGHTIDYRPVVLNLHAMVRNMELTGYTALLACKCIGRGRSLFSARKSELKPTCATAYSAQERLASVSLHSRFNLL